MYDPALDILTRAAGIDTVYSVSPHGEVLGARVTHTHGTGGVPAPVVWRDGVVDSFVFGDSAWRPVGEVIPSTEVASLEAISGDNRTLLAVSAAAEGSRLVTADAGTAGWNSWLRPGELKGTSGTYNIAAVIPTPAEETP